MHGWKLEADEFLSNFSPSGHPEVTYLLYEIQWGRSRRTWRNWCRNSHPKHAEIIFLEDEEIHDRPDITCNITWFLPWTPCGACAYHIIEFLEERPNVNLEILAAEVYRPYDQRNQEGLRDLADVEVEISIMEFSGLSDRRASQRWKIEPETFQRNYDPTECPASTFLLYEIRWDNGLETWKNWCTDIPDLHAEKIFLQNCCKKISLRKATSCSITWFLSWSPCHPCSQDIIEFLKAHPRVSLEIKAARIKHQDKHNQEGLGVLVGNEVKISIMCLPDYRYCWRTFVVPQRPSEDYWPRHFSSAIHSYSKQLSSILELSMMPPKKGRGGTKGEWLAPKSPKRPAPKTADQYSSDSDTKEKMAELAFISTKFKKFKKRQVTTQSTEEGKESFNKTILSRLVVVEECVDAKDVAGPSNTQPEAVRPEVAVIGLPASTGSVL